MYKLFPFFFCLWKVFFFFHTTEGRNKIHSSITKDWLETDNNSEVANVLHFSYRPNIFHNNMMNPKKITKQAILIQEAVVREPSAIHPICGTFLLNCLHKSFAITEEQNIWKPRSLASNLASILTASKRAPVEVVAEVLATPKNTLSPCKVRASYTIPYLHCLLLLAAAILMIKF